MLSTRFTKHSLVTEVHKTILPFLSDQSISIDATMGNGHDTLFLAQHSHKVYAFDIQENALQATRKRLENNHCLDKVNLIHAGHETLLEHIPATLKADAIVFNLGYLPHADTAIITLKKTTITALNAAISLLSDKGIISIITYPGHPGGQQELQAIIEWYQGLHYHGYAISIIHSMHEKLGSPIVFTLQNLSNYPSI
ncbi:tRNA (mnm(5)s(2)U34)-methyltransferase [Methyloprofundus sp.]|uniref:tRNA (mnm(5)s(2)U34)-methyltransferase n=1 Tax=Methyloprofundus sp. TaxID=2020875 RepID=UPI003D099F05